MINLVYLPIIWSKIVIIDELDAKLLRYIQRDLSTSLEKLGEEIGLSRNAVWRRLKSLEEAGIIKDKVALLDPSKLGLRLQVFIQIRTQQHDETWRNQFSSAIRSLPNIIAVHRMTGDLDYLIEAWLENMDDYDQFYQTLTSRVTLSDVSASFVMESLKNTTELPVIK